MARFAAWFGPFVIYALSAYRTVGFWDVGEMDVVPWMFRVAHPPGAPLYVLAGWLWSHALPFGPVAWRMSMLSVVTMSVAAWCVGRIVVELRADEAAACAASLLFAFGSVAWAIATRADVHAFETCLFAVAMLLWLRWYRTLDDRTLAFGAVAYGASIAVHPIGVWALGGILVLVVARLHDASPRALLLAGFAALALAFVPYLFLPNDVAFANGVATRGPFQGFDRFAMTLVRETWSALPIAVIGSAYAIRARDVRLAALAVAGAGSTLFALGFPEESDIARYYLPLFVAVSVACGYAIASAERGRRWLLGAAAVSAVVLLVDGRGYFHQPYDTRALDQSNDVLTASPSDAVLVATWVLAPTLQYRRDVDHATAQRLIVSSWYGDVGDRLPEWMRRRPVYVVGTPEGSVDGFRLERVAARTELYRVEREPSKR